MGKRKRTQGAMHYFTDIPIGLEGNMVSLRTVVWNEFNCQGWRGLAKASVDFLNDTQPWWKLKPHWTNKKIFKDESKNIGRIMR